MQSIAILGSNPRTVYNAPFMDFEWSIWACSYMNFKARDLPRIDEWFEVHDPAPHQTRSDVYLEYVRTLSSVIPVWVRDKTNKERLFPLARDYPEEQVKAEFPEPWFTSTIAYMLAVALLAKPKRIGLWGIMQKANDEYVYQRPGIQSFLWEAHRRGIEIEVPTISGLLELPAYEW